MSATPGDAIATSEQRVLRVRWHLATDIFCQFILYYVSPPCPHPNALASRYGTAISVSAGVINFVKPSRGHDGAWINDWGYESTKFTLNTSHTVAAAALLGRLPSGKTVEDLDQLLAEIPMSVPAVDQARERDFTCRIWIREAVRRMHAHRYIHCPIVDALEEEMRRYGMERSNNLTSVTCASLVSAVNSRAVE